jgi:hypothetical protein
VSTLPTAVIADRATEEIRARIAALPTLDRDELGLEEDRAARDFAGYTLHAQRPEEQQGDRTPRAWALREQRARVAAAHWLAVQAELDARR